MDSSNTLLLPEQEPIALPTLKFLITGGYGFLGGRLGHYLLTKGHYVKLSSRRFDLEAPEWLKNADVCTVDWADSECLSEICQGIDVVIHAAGPSAGDCLKDPSEATRLNSRNTISLLDASMSSGVSRFIYLSTAHVYSKNLSGHITERTPTTNLHPYANSHLAGERAVASFHKKGTLETVILRLSNAFGRPMSDSVDNWHLLFQDLCRQAVLQGKLRLRSNIRTERDFVSVSQVCRCVHGIACFEGEGVDGEVFNVGRGKSLTILQVAQLVQQRCEVTLGFYPDLLADVKSHESSEPRSLEYSIEKLQNLGIVLDDDLIQELDGLLAFCKLIYFKEGSSLLSLNLAPR
jgi:UDP-glucose 4-epimerase